MQFRTSNIIPLNHTLFLITAKP